MLLRDNKNKLNRSHRKKSLTFVAKRSSQKGTVLIITILIVAVITGLAIDFASRFQLSLSRAENRLALTQINQLVFAMEHAAIFGLKEDIKSDNDDGNEAFDHLNEDWKTKEFEFQGFLQILLGDEAEIVSLSLEDAQGRFNLNQLGDRSTAIDSSLPFKDRYRAQEKRFMRLLQTVPGDLVASDEAESILQAVIDWIDADNNTTGSGGAEANFYQGLEEPYSPANQNFVSVSELRQIKGVTEEVYEHLRPLSSALPRADAGININTALPEIMRTINGIEELTPIDEENGDTLSSSRPILEGDDSGEIGQGGQANKKEGFKTVEAFMQSEEVASVFGQDENLLPSTDGLTTGTGYFLLRSDIQLGNIRRQVYSLLQRSQDPENDVVRVSVIRRGSDDVF
jgi:general secretion pathway protein K